VSGRNGRRSPGEPLVYDRREKRPYEHGRGIHYAGLGRVVYSVSAESLASVRGTATSGIPCSEVIERKGGAVAVDGPVLEPEGIRVHEEYDG